MLYSSAFLGVVLCGGQSSRMGTDKGLLQLNGSTWASNAAQKFEQLQLPFVCAVAAHHQAAYSELFSANQLVMDDEALPVGGPLKGILSVHRQYSQKHLLVLAVDMPLVPIDLLQTLLDNATTNNAQAVVFKNGDQLEPLCAVYKSEGLMRILEKVVDGTLHKWSLHHVLQQLQAKTIHVDAIGTAFFSNFNAPEDLLHL